MDWSIKYSFVSHVLEIKCEKRTQIESNMFQHDISTYVKKSSMQHGIITLTLVPNTEKKIFLFA